MRVISRKRLKEFWLRHAKAKTPLEKWHDVASKARWTDFTRVRQTFSGADQVKVASRRTATVFNVAGNDYRLIAAIHYDREIVYVLRVLTHAEYDRGLWREQL